VVSQFDVVPCHEQTMCMIYMDMPMVHLHPGVNRMTNADLTIQRNWSYSKLYSGRKSTVIGRFVGLSILL
jgi:hypothetical protein